MADNSGHQSAVAIEYYFHRGVKYTTILSFLEKYHSIKLSRRTLINRLESNGLSRRGRYVDENLVRQYITEVLDGPRRLFGYRAMWCKFNAKHGICTGLPHVQ